MADTQDALKPCPFCGGERVGMATEHDHDGMGKFVSIKCQGCMGQGAQHFVSDGNECALFYREVRESWNRRATISASQPTDEREAFEKWAGQHKFVVDVDDGEYEFTATRLAWQAWQARALLCAPTTKDKP